MLPLLLFATIEDGGRIDEHDQPVNPKIMMVGAIPI
jgi:hypothetical protein